MLVIGRERERRLVCAAEFHRASVLRSGPIIAVDCATEEDLFVRALLGWSVRAAASSLVHPLWAAARGTLVLDRVTRMSPVAQKLLYDLVRRGPAEPGAVRPEWCGRLISASEEPPERAVARGAFSGPLLDCLDKVRVDVRSRHAA